MNDGPHVESTDGMRIDAHQHLWDLERFEYSWTRSFPTLRRSFRMEDYLASARGCDIGRTVFVECDVDEPHALDEARAIEQLSRCHPQIAGIVAAARPERADFPAQLEALLGLTKVRGVRRVLHVVPDGVSGTELFTANVRRLAPHRLTFDLCVRADQLPLAVALVRRCPEVQFILDHCGVPDVAGGTLDPWRGNLARIAELPNVACKLSGLVAYAGPDWKPDDLRPWVDHTLACFGADRVLWAGDWPVCTLGATLAEWVAVSDRLLAGASPDERDRLFRRNAETVYRL